MIDNRSQGNIESVPCWLFVEVIIEYNVFLSNVNF